jgi:hypothetical protein
MAPPTAHLNSRKYTWKAALTNERRVGEPSEDHVHGNSGFQAYSTRLNAQLTVVGFVWVGVGVCVCVVDNNGGLLVGLLLSQYARSDIHCHSDLRAPLLTPRS